MKTMAFLLLMFLLINYSYAQNCFWAEGTACASHEYGVDITTDFEGNIYAIGEFTNPTIVIGNDTLTTNNAGTENFMLIKYSIDGEIQWARNAAGIARGIGVSTDNIGNIYVVGVFDGTSTSFGAFTLTNSGAGDIFIVKYDPSGEVMWAKSWEGSDGWNLAVDVCTDMNGNVYMAGMYRSTTLTFDGETFANYSPGTNDIIISKCDENGNLIWARSFGGNSWDSPTGITTDNYGNVYVTGDFRSDSISFDGYMTYNDVEANLVYYLLKLDSTGTTVWVEYEGIYGVNTNGKEIVCKDDYVYVAGEFSGDVTLGGLPLQNNYSATSVFLIKYDLDGNGIWVKQGGGNFWNHMEGLTVDSAGNTAITGYYHSDSIVFDNEILYNTTPASAKDDIFIVRYDGAGSIISALNIGGNETDRSYGIAQGIGDNLYFTGTYNSPELVFASTVLTNVQYNDMFVADVYPYQAEIDSHIDASCYSASNGSATTLVSGGNLPYSYIWSTDPAQTTPDVSGLAAGTYTVTITEGYGCAQIDTVTISEPPAQLANICMVTTDSLSHYNVILWDKTQNQAANSYIIYREIETNNYQPIAEIPYSEPGYYIDTTRMLYFPNTGDPNEGTYRYKIQAIDTCGGSGELSAYHNTVFILNSNGIFYWTVPYSIEGQANPVSSYVLMRDNNSDGNWQDVSSVAGTQQTISDPLYVIYENTASWRVRTEWSINCSPAKSLYDYSLSNIYYGLLVGKKDIEQFSLNVYPNPTDKELNVTCSELVRSYSIIDITGKTIQAEDNINRNELRLSLQGVESGVYLMQVNSDQKVNIKRIVIN